MQVTRWVAVLATLWAGLPATAEGDGPGEVPRGLWATLPDGEGLIFHVRTRSCGRALCGRVERVKNRRGIDAPSNAVGDMVLWEMRPQPDGSFLGEYRDPRAVSHDVSRVTVVGRELRLEACDGQTCSSTVWTRIR